MLAIVLSFLAGAGVAGLWVLYIKAITKNRALPAAAADLAMALAGSLAFQAWAMKSNDFNVLASWDIGSALGTYLLIRFGFKR